MPRAVLVGLITLGAITLSVETSFAFGHGGGHGGPPMASIPSPILHGPTNHGGPVGMAKVRKLPPKQAGACYNACMAGMGSSWDPFCGKSCY